MRTDHAPQARKNGQERTAKKKCIEQIEQGETPMSRTIVDTILPTTMVGSYPRPHWFTYQLHGRDIWDAFKDVNHAEAFEDAVRTVLRDQEQAGLDILTDGQMWFDDYGGCIGSFVWYWYERIHGFVPVKHSHPLVEGGNVSQNDAAWLTDWGATSVTDTVRRGPLRLADLYHIAQRNTHKPVRCSVGAGPINLTYHVHLEHYKTQKDLAYALVPIFNAEMKEMVAGGATFLQLEDLGAWLPVLSGNTADFDWVVDVINKTVDGVDAKLSWHFCFGAAWGNASRGLFPSDAGYGSLLPHLHDTQIEQYVLDFAVREMEDAHILKDLPQDKEVAVGVIDVRNLQVETPEQVAQRIRKVLKFIQPERLTLTTDCGLRALPRFCAYNKLRAMVEGAQIVRAEIAGGPAGKRARG